MHHSAQLDHLRPVLLHGEAVYLRASSIRHALGALLGPAYADLLSVPRIPASGVGEGRWTLPQGRVVVPLPELEPAQQQALLDLLGQRIQRVMSLIVEFEASSDPGRQTLAKLLSRALDIPAQDCIYAVDSNPTLVCWAFFEDKVDSGRGYRLVKEVVGERFVAEAIHVPKDFDARVAGDAAPTEVGATGGQAVAVMAATRRRAGVLRRHRWLWVAGAAALLAAAFAGWYFLLRAAVAIDAGIAEPLVVDKVEGVSRQRVPGRLLVTVLPGHGAKDIEAVLRDKGLWQHVTATAVDPMLGAIQLKFAEAHYEAIRAALAATPWVTGVLPEHIQRVSVVPDDPVFRNGGVRSWPWISLNAPAAWDLTEGSDKTLIAVIDSAFDTTHPEFDGKRVLTWNAVNGKLDVAGPREVMLHGTHVAALAAGRADNRQGAAGTCPKCSLLLIRVADDQGRISDAAVLLALKHAMQWRASVVNLSFGAHLTLPDEGMTRAAAERFIAATQDEARFWSAVFRELRRQGAIVVQAAGNQGLDARVDPMKRNADALVVGAAGPGHRVSAFSNYGAAVTLTAPGEHVLSAVPGKLFQEMDGTSMAAPLVAGAVGLLRSVDARASFDDIRNALLQTGTPVQAAGGRGAGPDVNMAAALRLLLARGAPADGAASADAQAPGTPAACDCDTQLRAIRREVERLRDSLPR